MQCQFTAQTGTYVSIWIWQRQSNTKGGTGGIDHLIHNKDCCVIGPPNGVLWVYGCGHAHLNCLSAIKATRAGLPHQVLNAAQDGDEAAIIARAGEAGRITVATNMAGRGTDILLPPEVAEAGGLHVIMSERHEAGRIDRQLRGRTGRQGAPGSFEEILSLDDPLLVHSPYGRLAQRLHHVLGVGMLLSRLAQRKAEAVHQRMRHRLLQQDEQSGKLLSFSGRLE